MKNLTLAITFLFSVQAFPQESFKGEKAIVKSEFIYHAEDVNFPACHASTLAETGKGLIAAWFGGTAEKNPDVGIWVSPFENGKWSIPEEVANGIQHQDLRYPTWNPVLFNYGDELFLFYKTGPSPREWWGEYKISSDSGRSWSRAIRLPAEIYGPVKNKPLLLSNGRLICPSSTEDHGWRIHMEFTGDRGITWERTVPLNDGKKYGAIQPTLLIHPGGKLQALCRSRNKAILSAWSGDYGKTWTELEPTGLPNPNSGIDAVTLKDGRHILVYNHINPDESWGNRNILNLAVSNDGIIWKAGVLLENDPDPDSEYSYPAVIQTSDRMVHITYTWNRKLIKHVIIDPDLLQVRDLKNGSWPEE